MAIVASGATRSPYRSSGWSAIASGIVGVIALGFLIAAIASRISGGHERARERLIRSHDVGVILQSLLVIPLVLTLPSLGRVLLPGVGKLTIAMASGALAFVVLFLSLTIANVVRDVLYMVPQGALGVWLVLINRRLSSVLPKALSRLGIVSGIGLVLVALFPLAYGIFVDPIGLHIILLIGTFMGVATYPVWTVLAGRRLIQTT